MTLASALYGGGSELDYLSNNLYFAINGAVAAGASTPNEDNLVPFAVRKTVTVDGVAWYRDNTSAGNAYVGIYSVAGVLLTDCAVDANTTVGWHSVSTTAVTLLAGQVYYAAWNASADVAGIINISGFVEYEKAKRAADFGLALGLGAAPSVSSGPCYVKARTNAALLANLVMSGWAIDNLAAPLGFVVQ